MSSNITIACPTKRAYDSVHPKQKLAVTARKLDIPIPKTFLPVNEEDLPQVEESFSFPCIRRERHQKITNRQDLRQAFVQNQQSYNAPPLIQEMVEGEDYCHAVLFQQGRIIASNAYKNLYSFPAESGSGVMRESVDPSIFDQVASTLLEAVGWSGVAQLDFRWDGNVQNQPYLIECKTNEGKSKSEQKS